MQDLLTELRPNAAATVIRTPAAEPSKARQYIFLCSADGCCRECPEMSCFSSQKGETEYEGKDISVSEKKQQKQDGNIKSPKPNKFNMF